MVLAGLEEDAVSGADHLDGPAAPLAVADAFEDVDRLAVRMGVPGGASAGREVAAARAQPRGRGGCCDRVDVDGAGEPVTRPGLGVQVFLAICIRDLLFVCGSPAGQQA